MAMITVMLPCFLFAMYEKHGQPLEVVVKNIIQTKFIAPKERPYRTCLLYTSRTEKGEFNRWIKATNAVIRGIKKKMALLFDWIAEAKAEIAKPQAPDLVSLPVSYTHLDVYKRQRDNKYS